MDYIFGYGSLLSAYSREHYSNIRSSVTTATVSGWSRSWCAVYPDEGATYAGATPDSSKHLDGVLIASEINQDLAKRERGYRFARLKHENLSINCNELDICENDKIRICETLSIDASCQLNPLPQSYVDTCISGCIESQGMAAAGRFIKQTQGWDCVWVNDRHLNRIPIYPRYTPVSEEQAILIDSLLEEHGVLRFRRPDSS